jgi:hypothetical protein
MTILLEQELPVPRAMIEAVSAEMGVRDNPPPGLIAHLAIESGEGTRIVDIWNSKADYEAFRDARLNPAVDTVAAAAGQATGMPMPDPVYSEAFDVVLGK